MAMGASATLEIDRYVVDTLMRDLVRHDRRPSTFLVYLAILAAADRKGAALSHEALAERTGLSRRGVQNAVRALARRQLIRISRKGATDIAVYRPLSPWSRRDN